MVKKKTPLRKTSKKQYAEKSRSIEEQVRDEVARQMPRVETGIAVAMPNTVEQKMRAICDLSSAVKSLATALSSTNVNVRIEDCNFHNLRTALRID